MLCLDHCFIWLRDLVTKTIGVEVFVELRNVVLEENEKKKWSEKVTNAEVLERIGEKKMVLISCVEKSIELVIF